MGSIVPGHDGGDGIAKLLTAGAVLLDQHLPQSLFQQLYLQLGKLQLVLELFDEFCVP